MLLLLSADFYRDNFFSKFSFRKTIRISNSLDPDQAPYFVRPDLGTYCLQRISADNSSRQRVNSFALEIGKKWERL